MFVSIPEQIIESVQNDVRQFEEQFKVLSNLVLDQKISKYPIFIAHREKAIAIGRPYINAEKEGSQWSFNISHLEEFAHKSLIQAEKLVLFKESYKEPRKNVCLFIISGEKDGGFAFYPYHE